MRKYLVAAMDGWRNIVASIPPLAVIGYFLVRGEALREDAGERLTFYFVIIGLFVVALTILAIPGVVRWINRRLPGSKLDA